MKRLLNSAIIIIIIYSSAVAQEDIAIISKEVEISSMDLVFPWCLEKDSKGNIYIADYETSEITVLDEKYSEMRLIKNEHIRNPYSIKISNEDKIIVADSIGIKVIKDYKVISRFVDFYGIHVFVPAFSDKIVALHGQLKSDEQFCAVIMSESGKIIDSINIPLENLVRESDKGCYKSIFYHRNNLVILNHKYPSYLLIDGNMKYQERFILDKMSKLGAANLSAWYHRAKYYNNNLYVMREDDKNANIYFCEIDLEKSLVLKRWKYRQNNDQARLFIKDYLVVYKNGKTKFICTSIDKEKNSKIVELKEQI